MYIEQHPFKKSYPWETNPFDYDGIKPVAIKPGSIFDYYQLPKAFPQINQYKEGYKLYIEAYVPGLKKEEIEISWDKDSLIINCTKTVDTDKNITTEYNHFNAVRYLCVPADKYEIDTIAAELKDGVLTISVEEVKQEPPKDTKIKININ